MSSDSDHFCPYFDHGLFIGANPEGTTGISMCCWQKRTMVSDRVTFDHPVLLDLRNRARQSIPKECSPYCSQPGHIANERERSRQDSWWTSSGKIKKLHLEQSLACNLTCISCSSQYSSAWNAHYHKFDQSSPVIKLKKQPQLVWEHLDFSELEQIHFTGGEPLMNPDNLRILQHLNDIGRLGSVGISYCTNGTVRPDERWLALWKKSKWVRLFFSLDGVGTTFEYTRYPARWSEVESNMHWFAAQKDICILIEVDGIIGIHNIFNLPDFFNWWKTSGLAGSQGDPGQIFVRSIEPSSHGGRVLDLRYLPEAYRKSAEQVLYSVKDCPGALGLIDKLCQAKSDQWLDYFEQLDAWRGTNWRKDLQLLENV